MPHFRHENPYRSEPFTLTIPPTGTTLWLGRVLSWTAMAMVCVPVLLMVLGGYGLQSLERWRAKG